MNRNKLIEKLKKDHKDWYYDIYLNLPIVKFVDNCWDNLIWFKEYVESVCAYAQMRKRAFEFDYTFILKTLEFALRRNRKCIENGLHAKRKLDAKKIRTCELLCQRMYKSEYTDKDEDRAWYEDDDTTTKFLFKDLQLDIPKNQAVCAPKMSWKEIAEKEDKMFQQDMNLLYKILRRNLRGWWS